MRLLYSTLLYLAVPFVLLRLLWRGVRQRAYWHGVGERFGGAPRQPDGVAVWVHAVSVGEALAAVPLIRRLLVAHRGSVLVTTTTPTGAARVRAALGAQVALCYAPYDLPDAVARFMRRVRPRRAIVMETELWPNLFRAVARAGVPLVIANARLSPRSFARYRWPLVRSLTASVLADCAAIAAQSDADAQRFRDLGADPARVHMPGNLKFDLELPADAAARGRALRARWGAARPVWIAASTHEGEEAAALHAHRTLRARFPDAVLVLVPRHPQRFDAVARVIESSGLRAARRSALDLAAPTPLDGIDVLFGDSMGELPLYLGASDVAFVGGSLVPVGGHNVLEPASLGVPVLFGPHMFNFEQASALLLAAGAARQIDGAPALAATLTELLEDGARRAAMGRAGQDVVRVNRGALQRLATLIENV